MEFRQVFLYTLLCGAVGLGEAQLDDIQLNSPAAIILLTIVGGIGGGILIEICCIFTLTYLIYKQCRKPVSKAQLVTVRWREKDDVIEIVEESGNTTQDVEKGLSDREAAEDDKPEQSHDHDEEDSLTGKPMPVIVEVDENDTAHNDETNEEATKATDSDNGKSLATPAVLTVPTEKNEETTQPDTKDEPNKEHEDQLGSLKVADKAPTITEEDSSAVQSKKETTEEEITKTTTGGKLNTPEEAGTAVEEKQNKQNDTEEEKQKCTAPEGQSKADMSMVLEGKPEAEQSTATEGESAGEQRTTPKKPATDPEKGVVTKAKENESQEMGTGEHSVDDSVSSQKVESTTIASKKQTESTPAEVAQDELDKAFTQALFDLEFFAKSTL